MHRTVDKVQSKITKQVYARKRISRKRDFNKDKEVIARFENEVQILKKLDHVHLVKVFASYTDLNYVAIIMKPVAQMDLKHFLRSSEMQQTLRGAGRSRFRTYYGCLASAISYLHDNKIRHKDIKPSNILLKNDDIYITDFGTAIEFDGDKSMTKGTVRAKTTQYQSPEVARGAKRGTASDIWSLGVTYLEMTTVLRGETLDSMQDFLLENGTNDEYIFENIQGAIKWTEYLRKKTKFPRVDNSPMQWIRDMLLEKALERPTASKLCGNIRQVADGAFSGKCCRGDGSTASDISTDEDGEDDDTIRPTATLTAPTRLKANPGKAKSRPPLPQDKNLDGPKQTVEPDPVRSTIHPRRAPLHKKVFSSLFTYLPNVSIPRFHPDNQVEGEDDSTKSTSTVMPESSYVDDPYLCNVPGAFPESIPDPKAEQVSAVFQASPITESPFDGDCLFNPDPYGFVTQIPGSSHKSFPALKILLQQPSRGLVRSRSDENLEIQRLTKSILANSAQGFEDTLLTQQRPRRPSEGCRPEFLEEWSRTSMKVELERFKKEFEESSVSRNVSFPPQPSSEDDSFDAGLTPSTVPANLQEPPQELDKKDSLQPKLPSTDGPRVPSRPQISVPPAAPSALNTHPKQNLLMAWIANARGPPSTQKTSGPPRLTEANLGVHNVQVPPKKKSPPPFKIEAASVYMRKVFDDTASSVATSVMSTRTRQSFKLYGLMLPLQDRTQNFLGKYTKMGKADAVRMLLREGCNPGTKKDPRPGPIFDVVRGASSRHTKCLRALIAHDVNVNVRKNGKTPLLEAVDHEAWSGYVTVIYLLLAAGANPNAKDASGDVPLLKLLEGGQEPLEEHRRRALALLLSPSYKTDVDVTPLGTQNKPLHLAIRRNDPWAVGMLLEKNDSVIEAKNSEGLTPLLLAARSWSPAMTSDQLEILDLLLEKKAKVDVKMPLTDKTPLHMAISHGLVHVTERLLEHGADVHRKTREGKTAFEIAAERKKQHGCRDNCESCSEVKVLIEKNGPEIQRII
jgi:serine/threonine protein kinase